MWIRTKVNSEGALVTLEKVSFLLVEINHFVGTWDSMGSPAHETRKCIRLSYKALPHCYSAPKEKAPCWGTSPIRIVTGHTCSSQPWRDGKNACELADNQAWTPQMLSQTVQRSDHRRDSSRLYLFTSISLPRCSPVTGTPYTAQADLKHEISCLYLQSAGIAILSHQARSLQCIQMCPKVLQRSHTAKSVTLPSRLDSRYSNVPTRMW